MKKIVLLMGLLLLAGLPALAADARIEDLGVCPADDRAALELEEVKGKPGGGGLACCNPADEPGVGGNPFCFEGATCCTDGTWRCNNPDATPSCDVGDVCDGPCSNRGDSCSSNDDCCSGTCKRNGRCA